MSFLQNAGTDIYAFFILLLILVVSFSRIELTFFSYRVFLLMVISTMAQLIIEAVVWYISFSIESSQYLTVHILNGVFLILNPIPPLLWVIYASYELFESEERSIKLLKKLGILLLLNSLVVVIAPINSLLFTAATGGPYRDSFAISSTAILCFFYMVFSMIMVLRRWKVVDRKRFFSILFFSLPPIGGALIDMAIPGVSTLWPSVVISILFIYINLQKHRANTDPLTGLYNRRQLEHRLERLIQGVGYTFGLIIIDIDDFKIINDNFGHVQGDKTLEDISIILKESFRLQDYVSRYAGDEFIILLKVDSDKELEAIINRLNRSINLYNRKALIKVSLSIGASLYNKEMNYSPRDFIEYVDNLMYIEKAAGK